MAQNFIDCDREQAFLMPPWLRDWLAEDHLAWFVIDTVDRLDLSVFYGDYRADGRGRAAYEPSMMVSLVLYAFSTNMRSSRQIECHCRQDVAYRVITANRVPDHSTVARFIDRHQVPMGELFSSVLRLCAKAGLVKSGVVAVDGTKLSASASSDSNVDYDEIAREVIAQTVASDAAEDDEHGDARGDELPEELRTEEGRREWLVRQLEPEDRAAHGPRHRRAPHPGADPARLSKRQGERPGWTGGRYAFMRRVLASDLGRDTYKERQRSIEPVYGDTKHNRKFDRFLRRGRKAVRTEWRLVMTTHNLTKLHRHQIAAQGA